MNWPLLTSLLFAIGSQMASPAVAADKLFVQATETDDELKELFDRTRDNCLHSISHDVRIVVACASMRIYGLALNERDWCYGHRDEANAQMDWHRCDASSERFSLDKLIDAGR
jgi:K+-sensing histidine kinase KdpD